MGDSEEVNIEQYAYHIVEFVKRGRQSIREIEIIPLKWIKYDNKLGKLKAFYKKPPYTEDDFKLIQNLSEANADAPANWELYTIKLVARASKYLNKFFSLV